MASITSANSIFMLSIAGLYPVPQKLQGYAADDVFSTEAINQAEIVMGVDGNMSAGFVHVARAMTVHVMPDQGSDIIFDTWMSAQEAAQELYFANGIVSLPSIGASWVLTKGVLTNIQPIPGVKKTLQPRPFTITWQSIMRVPG